MSQETDDRLIDLLEKRAVYGLTDEQLRQLDGLDQAGDTSFDLAVAAINLAELGTTEEMPPNLRARITADANEFFADKPIQNPAKISEPAKPGIGLFGWLGWAVAAAAIVALIVNIALIRNSGPQVASGPTSTPMPTQLGPEQLREQLIKSAPDLATADIGAGNMKDVVPKGDIVWSDSRQAGYIHVKGLPKNDPTKQQYQLWIFDENQDPKTPVDGGVFDVSSDGEVVIPINAKLQVRNPKLFAITIEKPGGVVVSKQEKVASLAKRET